MNYFRCIGGNGGGTKQFEPYIYNIGRCAFNTNYVPKTNTKIKMKAVPSYASQSSYGYMFSSNPNDHQDTWFGFEARTGRPYFYRCNINPAVGAWYYNESSNNFLWLYTPQIFEIEGKSARWYREEVPTQINELSLPEVSLNDCISPIALFAKNFEPYRFGATDFGMMSLFYFDVYENDNLIHDFIPAYHNDQFCLYDTVEDVYIYDTYSNGQYVRGFVLNT